MQPGDLNERVTIEARSQSDDGGGGGAETWTPLATVWARVRPLSGRERVQAQQVEADVSYRVVIRNRADVTAAHRIVWRNRAMQIRVIHDAGPRPLYLTIDCEDGPVT